jgi:hypothetical protein
LGQKRKIPFRNESVVALRRLDDCLLNLFQIVVHSHEIDFFLCLRRAHVARNIEVEIVLLDLCHVHTAGIARLFRALPIRVDDLVDLFGLPTGTGVVTTISIVQ